MYLAAGRQAVRGEGGVQQYFFVFLPGSWSLGDFCDYVR